MDNLVKLRRYPGIDYFKVYAAILVVFIHAYEIRESTFSIANVILNCFTGQAVPFFLIISGFLFSKKIQSKIEWKPVLLKYVLNLFVLYIVWEMLWFPYTLNIYHTKYPEASSIYIFLILIRCIFFAGSGVYWYLLVLLESIAVCTFMKKYRAEKVMYIIALVGCIWGLLYDSGIEMQGMSALNHLIYLIFSWSNNFIMKGIPYTAVGFFLSDNEEKISAHCKNALSIYIISALVSILLYSCGIRIFFWTPILAILLAISGIVYSPCWNLRLCKKMRDFSTVCFMIHTIIIYFLIDPIIGIEGNIWLKYVLTIVLAIIGYIVINRINWKPINWLMSVK